MKTINLGSIDLDIHDGNIGVSVSGGADSAILLYMLMKYSEPDTTIHVISCGSEQKHYMHPRYAYNVIEQCMRLTGFKNVKQHVFFLDVQTRQDWLKGTTEYFDNKTVKLIYSGVTATPPVEVCESFNGEIGLELNGLREPHIVRQVYYPKIYAPFTNIDKQQVAEFYKSEGVLETLYPYTRSCENLAMTEGHCGTCWWCQERKWGFGYL
jgi:7-cyano-7-deazaguanine synthase in queuosine biosynthesis